ncbi:MAG TPA: CDP-glycerol glycerophosphotransferase family protein [Candidatus Agrococcus pullicola]|uniref:CDP-glycerol glycerophosphotransferase family protein n=1 Tax=Candidatus Agrococcus pullicola TaxID=2838429 RepID=A0A9D1YXH3_9MICO|nr:CDP-glycerol glycerophosphotransferase family protein [uncultured Agrococcus sp.]HIY67101.1 CDP-glycerol glycerophosphotransferase family protein [Candidatus Agrococcus pullicola]
MRQWLRKSRILRAMRFLHYLVPYWLLRPFVRVRPRRFLFLSDSHDGYVGNMAFLKRAIEQQAPDAEIIGVFKPRLSARRPLRDALRLPMLIASSGVIVLDDFYPLIYFFRIRPDARLVQLWHAAGAFKRVGHSRAGLPGGPTRGSEIHRNYTDAVVSSESIVPDYAEAFGIDPQRVKPWGMPRSDAFFDEAAVAETRHRVREALGIADGDRFVLYAPTFRGQGQLTAQASPDADWAGISRTLGAGWRVGVRQHPFVADKGLPQGVIDAASIPDMNEVLMATDVLVTDYSSAVFEFSLLRRPIVFFVPDLEEYVADRSFYRPFEHYCIGPVVRDAEGLAAAIATATVDPARSAAFDEEFCGALDGHSSERIASRLLGGA